MTFNQLKESVEIFSKYSIDDDDIKVYDGQLEIDCGDVEEKDSEQLYKLGWYQNQYYWIVDLA